MPKLNYFITFLTNLSQPENVLIIPVSGPHSLDLSGCVYLQESIMKGAQAFPNQQLAACCAANEDQVGSREAPGHQRNHAVTAQDSQQQFSPPLDTKAPQSLYLFLEGYVLSVDRVSALHNRCTSFFQRDSNRVR